MRTLLRHVFIIIFSLLAACSFSQTTGYSGTGSNIDVTYHRCEWRINPDSASKGIKGDVTVYFVTKKASVSSFTLDLRRSAFNNASLSAKYHGAATTVTFPTTGDSIRITLPSALPLNTFDSVTISYNGAPPAVSGQAEGYQKKGTVGSTAYIYTLSESFEDRDWWPCKADMQDKIDSMDIYINTPSAFTAVSNGKLIDSVTVGANQVFHWKTQYPIPSYLVAVGVARYRVYDRGTVNIGGTNVPVWYFLFPGKTNATYTSIVTALDNSMAELTAFSSKFGDYGFTKEKHGYYEFGWGGGMEHQSISAMGSGVLTDWSVIAHELGHQWFGDKVTFGTWNHLWLAEGFAEYMTALAAELVPALGKNPSTVRSGFKSAANNATNAPYGCYIPDGSITNSNILWNSTYGTTVYQRGAMVVSMLRKLMGDTKFFQACRNYLNDPALAYNSATTDDFKNHCAAVLGYNLDAFFNDFVGSASAGGSGYPTYTVNWGNNGKRINIELTTQTRTSAATSYFRTPVVLKISNGSTDTTVVIYDQNGVVSYAGDGILKTISGKRVGYNLSFVPTSVAFDPDNETLATGSASFNAALNNVVISVLDVKIVDFKVVEKEEGNLLSLSIASNSDKARFTLERSEDGTHFSAIGEMANEMNTVNGLSYSFLDTKVSENTTYYYRVKATEENGQITYSKTISILRQADKNNIIISPNPAHNDIRISLPDKWKNKQVSYTIYSSNGMVIKKERITAGTDIRIALENVASGNYMIELSGDDGKVSSGFTVVH